MDRDLLFHLPVVAAIARLESFARAGAELGMSASAVSHAVRLVETRLGVPIFARTTRSVALTEAGAAFLSRALPGLAAIDEAAVAMRAAQGVVTGTLRVNAPRIALPLVLTRMLGDLARRHPALVVEVTTDEGLADIVGEGFDAGVRLGSMVAQDMVAVRLTPPFEAILVAAPAYLAASGTPRRLDDLSRHNCINYRRVRQGGVYPWDLRGAEGDVAVAVRGSACVTDSMSALELAVAGVGIAYLFAPLAEAALANGTLCRVLPETAITEPGLFLYFPRRAAEAPKLRAFIDAIPRPPR